MICFRRGSVIPTGTMNLKTIVGIVLILAGAALLASKIMVKEQETVIDAGPLGKIQAETRKPSKLAPIAGGVMLVGGILVLVTGKKKA